MKKLLGFYIVCLLLISQQTMGWDSSVLYKDGNGNIGSHELDFDTDGRNNFYEYVLKGDPTDEQDMGTDPVLKQVDGALHFIHLHRTDDPNLMYRVQTTTNLISGAWVDAADMAVGTNAMESMTFFNEVTNRIPGDTTQSFIRMNVRRR
jgi:hypothetical protein